MDRAQLGSSLPGILLHTCGELRREPKIGFGPWAKGWVPVENLFCLRCNQELEAGHKSVAVYMFTQTVGVRPRQKSGARRICFCPQCSVSLAMGPAPEGALNVAAWQMIRDLVGAHPALTEAAWSDLSGSVDELPATGTDGALPPARTAGYFEF